MTPFLNDDISHHEWDSPAYEGVRCEGGGKDCGNRKSGGSTSCHGMV